jgi:asparagine synthetase B (glutamine-hydrolysing)
MQNLTNFIIISNRLVPDKGLPIVSKELVSTYAPVVYKEHFCFYHGIFHNFSELSEISGTGSNLPEEVLIELFLKDEEKFPTLLSGNFSIVIGNEEQLYLLRDGNGYENLYFSFSYSDINCIIISNSIKEIARYCRLEVNTDILPGYFLKTDLNSGETFFKNIETLSFFEYVRLNIRSHTIERGIFEKFFRETETVSNVNIKQVINECDNLLGNIINEKVKYLSPEYKIINALSGGTDSSFIQYYLKRNSSDIAYTANFENGGLDHLYAADISKLLDLTQKTVNTGTGYLVESIPSGIFLSEKPFMFGGESLLQHMYEEIGKDYEVPVACFDGTGAEGIFGASRILYELRMIRKYRRLSGIILPLIRFKSPELYNRYSEFHKYVNTGTVPENFVLRYFTSKQTGELVRKAFNLSSLSHIDDFEVSMMRKYNTTLFEAVYRFLAFELEFRRVNNVRTQIAKKHGVMLVFPFTDSRIYKYFIKLDSDMKLRNAKTKYIFRKAMEKKFPKRFVYRKKIMKNVSVFDEILQNQNVREIIREIKEKHYSYFNFNYDEIFGSPKYSSLAYKLINFHLWHRLFIDREEVDGIRL